LTPWEAACGSLERTNIKTPDVVVPNLIPLYNPNMSRLFDPQPESVSRV
jgi:hypothetical protein